MAKNVEELIKPVRVKIPVDLLKKFQAESSSGLEFLPFTAPGVMVFPEEILAKLGYGGLSKAGLDVIIVPRVAER
jgi:hypothetical protein